MKQLQSFHNDEKIKAKYVKRLAGHYKANEIRQCNYYWKNGKGDAVGCTIHSSQQDIYKKYETELGIPEWVARLMEKIFDHISKNKAKKFAIQFLDSIPVGVTETEFNTLKYKFFMYLVQNIRQFDPDRYPKAQDVVNIVVELCKKELEKQNSVTKDEWAAAEEMAFAVTQVSLTMPEAVAWAAGEATPQAVAGAVLWGVPFKAGVDFQTNVLQCGVVYEKIADKLLALLQESKNDLKKIDTDGVY